MGGLATEPKSYSIPLFLNLKHLKVKDLKFSKYDWFETTKASMYSWNYKAKSFLVLSEASLISLVSLPLKKTIISLLLSGLDLLCQKHWTAINRDLLKVEDVETHVCAIILRIWAKFVLLTAIQEKKRYFLWFGQIWKKIFRFYMLLWHFKPIPLRKIFSQKILPAQKGSPMGSSKHTKTFFGKMFDYFFSTLMKNTFAIISRFFSPKLAGII